MTGAFPPSPLPRLPLTRSAPGAGAVPCAFQPLDSSKLPSPSVWNWTPRMRAALSVGLQEAPQSRDGAPLSVSSSHPGIFTADPDGGERKGPTVLWEPHQEDCQAAGPGVTGVVGGGTDKCWLVEVNQARAGSPAAALLGEGRPHLLRTPCSKEGEPLVSASKWRHSCSCPGDPPVPPACTGGLPAGLLRKLTAMGSLLASQSRPAAPWCSAKGLLASPPPLWGQHHQPHGSCGMETQRSLVSSTHLLASAEGTHWGTKGRGQDWDFFVINGKEQVYE